MRAIDVHGFAGGFTLGAAQAGFELVGKMSREVGFGVYNTLHNRHLLPGPWDSYVGKTENGEPAPEWEVLEAEYVFGNPPCSGFSTLSPASYRGMDASINNCMWELVRYAAAVKPEIVAWESVQQTFRQGLPLLRDLHAELEERSGHRYTLFHVLHNNAALGGVSIRKRYFWVASRIPFGVEKTTIDPYGNELTVTQVPTFGDMLRDLEPLGMSMAPQPYRTAYCKCTPPENYEQHVCKCDGRVRVQDSSWWCEREVHDFTGLVDGHQRLRSPSVERTLEVIDGYNETPGVEWREGERAGEVMKKYYLQYGRLPDAWDYPTWKTVDGDRVQLPKVKRLIETNFAMGHNQLTRWYWDRMARVITGGACHLVLHPHLNRTLTQREAARIQGFPDAWKIYPVRFAPDLGPGWGKGVPVQAGRWISHWAAQSLRESPGGYTGLPLAETHPKLATVFGGRDREYVIDFANDYKPLVRAIGDPG